MKVVILAGGKGTRLSEYTKSIPKPMVKINKIPIIVHIMKHYSKHGFKDFIIAAGYKKKIIQNYFKKKINNWNVRIVDTGKNTMTGGRIKRLKKYLGNEAFLLTYGDGVSDVNIKSLLKFHKKSKSIITLTAVRPPARFGAVTIKKNKVVKFKEKSKLGESWINGGFFIIEPGFFSFIRNDGTYLEKEPLENLSADGELMAFKHAGFWHPVDTLRDKNYLNDLVKKGEAPWL